MTPSPPPQEQPEQSIGSYRLQKKLGAGGMGEVFLAYDDRLRRNVAIKRIRAGASMSPAQRERFRREARAAAALNHPSVVQVYDIIEDPDGDAIVMEYLEGRTLWEMITEGDLDGRTALSVLLQVADGVEAAHQRGLVHRDLKAENVIVDDAGNGKILDFGVAKSNEPTENDQSLTTAGMAVGTFRSMSPEQCEGRPVDARSDLFSLGVLMYEMFGGRTPFAGKTPLHTLANVVGFNPPTIRELNRSVPDSLSDLTQQLMAKEPDDRPASAAAVADVLETLQEPGVSGGIVMPRLTVTPDSGIDPIGSKAIGRTGHARRRRMTTVVEAGRRPLVSLRTLLGLGAVVVAGVVAVVVTQGRGAATDLDGNRVMVFPLVTSDTERTSVGEDVATMIGAALGGTDPLRWIDGWPLLEGEARNNIRALTTNAAAELARSRGAAWFIDGRVLANGADSSRVILSLRESSAGEEVAAGQGVGPRDTPWRGGLDAVNELLPVLVQTTVPDVGESFADRPPGAVAQFLLGEQEFRRANVDVALEHFQAAFRLDSTFAIAGMRGAEAASWEHASGPARDLLRAVVRQPLPPMTDAYARGLLAFMEYDAEAAITHLNIALDLDSAFTPGWVALGEVYRHQAPRVPWMDGARPFARAVAQDPNAGYVLFHGVEEVMRDGDLARATDLRQRFTEVGPDANLLRQVNVMYECLEGGPAASDWEQASLDGSANVEFAAGQFSSGGRNLPCAEALMRSVVRFDTTSANAEARYWATLLTITGSKLAQKRFDDVRRLIDAAATGFEAYQALIEASTVDSSGVVLPQGDAGSGPSNLAIRSDRELALTRWSEFAIVLGAVYPDLADVAERGAEDLRFNLGDDYDGPGVYRTSVWMLGLWDALQGRPAAGLRAVDQVREMASGYTDPVARDYSLRLADALDIHRVRAEGGEAEALEKLRGLTANADEGWVFVELNGSLAYERWVQATLEERIGEPERALNLVRGFDEPSALTYIVYLPPGLATCVRVATQLRRTAEAQACQSRLESLGWSVDDFEPR